MKIFLIESETDNITVYTIAKDAEAVQGAERFRNEAGLAKLAANWPVGRLVDIWNSLPGVTPVKKFKDRATAVARIWKVIQNMGEAVAEAKVAAQTETENNGTVTQDSPQTPDVAPPNTASTKKATRAKKPPTAPPTAATKTPGAREGSKTEIVVGLLKRVGGVTLAELMTATGWQAHSVRGFIAGTAKKKLGLTIVSAKSADGGRVYSIEA